ncbi:MAG: BLUF domain-containing protein [Bacteroidota bacterium]
MFALTYVSQATAPFSGKQLTGLEAEANQKNQKLGVTGFLNYRKGRFLQYLEGEKDKVIALMSRIEQDERHSVDKVLHLPDVDERRFSNWYMRFLRPHEMAEIGLEPTLEEVLVNMKPSLYGEDRVYRIVNRLVGSIAELYQKHPIIVRHHPDKSSN